MPSATSSGDGGRKPPRCNRRDPAPRPRFLDLPDALEPSTWQSSRRPRRSHHLDHGMRTQAGALEEARGEIHIVEARLSARKFSIRKSCRGARPYRTTETRFPRRGRDGSLRFAPPRTGLDQPHGKFAAVSSEVEDSRPRHQINRAAILFGRERLSCRGPDNRHQRLHEALAQCGGAPYSRISVNVDESVMLKDGIAAFRIRTFAANAPGNNECMKRFATASIRCQ